MDYNRTTSELERAIRRVYSAEQVGDYRYDEVEQANLCAALNSIKIAQAEIEARLMELKNSV